VVKAHPLIRTFGMLSMLQGAISVYTDRSVGIVVVSSELEELMAVILALAAGSEVEVPRR
jgi:hypothetical protein